MIKDVRHIGIVVNDMDISLKFYKDLLGLKIKSLAEEEGEFLDNMIYHISFNQPHLSPVTNREDMIKIKFNCNDAENKLKIDTINGKINDDGSIREVKEDDINIRKQTLLEEQYYLDSGKFKLKT